MKTIEEVYDDYLYDCYIANQRLTEEDWLLYGKEAHHIEVPNRDGGILTPLNSQYLTTYQHWVAGVLQSEVLQKWCAAFVPKNVLSSTLEKIRKKWCNNNSPGSVKGGCSTRDKKVGVCGLNRRQLQEAQRKADKRIPIVLIHPDGREEYFLSVTEAANTYNLNRPHLCAVMKGERNQHKGFTARYID